MYLGAMRVKDEDGNQPFSFHYYRHNPSVSAESLSDVRWVARSSPGRLVKSETQGKAGGRSVLSFLDVSGPEGATIDQVEQVLSELRKHVEKEDRTPLKFNGFGADFYAGKSFSSEANSAEFEQLSQALLTFAQGALELPSPRRELTVRARREGIRTVFAWEPASRAKILEIEPNWQSTTVSIDDDVRASFEQTFGSFYPHAIEALCPFKEDMLDAIGGAQIIDESGQTLWFT